MKNIFENAYLGKMYKTRDGRKSVLYSHTLNDYGFVIIHDRVSSINHACIYEVNRSGEVYHECDQGTDDLDIVAEWEE